MAYEKLMELAPTEVRNYLFKFLEYHASEFDWHDRTQRKQLRALFTAACIVGDLDLEEESDYRLCDQVLDNVYIMLEHRPKSYEDFSNFMIDLVY